MLAEVLTKTQETKQTKSKEKKFRQRIKQYSHQKQGTKMTISESKKKHEKCPRCSKDKTIQGAWRIRLWPHWQMVGSLKDGEKFAHSSLHSICREGPRHGKAWAAIVVDKCSRLFEMFARFCWKNYTVRFSDSWKQGCHWFLAIGILFFLSVLFCFWLFMVFCSSCVLIRFVLLVSRFHILLLFCFSLSFLSSPALLLWLFSKILFFLLIWLLAYFWWFSYASNFLWRFAPFWLLCRGAFKRIYCF